MRKKMEPRMDAYGRESEKRIHMDGQDMQDKKLNRREMRMDGDKRWSVFGVLYFVGFRLRGNDGRGRD